MDNGAAPGPIDPFAVLDRDELASAIAEAKHSVSVR